MILKEILGKKFKEGMTFEEVEKALEDVEVLDDAKYIARSEYVKVKKQKDEACREAKEYKNKYRETLTEKEQLELDQKEKDSELQSKYDELLRKTTISEQKDKLIEAGYDPKLALDTATAFVDSDFAKIIANQAKFAEAVKKKTTSELLEETPTPEGGSDDDGVITAEKFKKMSLREKQELKNTDPTTFNNLTGGGN